MTTDGVPGYVFCARVGDHPHVQYRFVDLAGPEPMISGDSLTALASWSQRAYPDICAQLVSETGIDPELVGKRPDVWVVDAKIIGHAKSVAEGEGAIIVNWGTVIAGRLVVLTAGSPEYQEALAVELEARLC